MKKIMVLMLSFCLLVLLSGCFNDKDSNNDSDTDKELQDRINTAEDLDYYLTTSKELSSVLYSNSTFEKLKKDLDGYKDEMELDLFENRFDLSNDMNRIYYSFDGVVSKFKVLNIFADYVQDGSVVKIVLIGSYTLEMPEGHEYTDHYHTTPLNIVTQVFEYNKETKKLVDYKLYE